MKQQTLLIGLDCAPPALVFQRYRNELPHLRQLMESGMWGPLRSTKPPITVPAWACMTTGKDPGELGLYGFRNRVKDSYELKVATSEKIKEKQIWDWIGEAGYSTASLFVPHCWPPSHIRGWMVSGCLTPSLEVPWTTPENLADEITSNFGSYIPDVENFRRLEKKELLGQIYKMTRQHFEIAQWVLENKQPDFLMMVEMGPDRLHHGFWNFFDPVHPNFCPGNAFEDAAKDYYMFLDTQVGQLLRSARDNAHVIVVSDHGAKAMKGGFCINEWLRETGWLVLRKSVSTEQLQQGSFDKSWVDWTKTKAWGEGGYYGRVFLNVQGREPEGIVSAKMFEATRKQLQQEMNTWFQTKHPHISHDLNTPQQMYRKVRGQAPDLFLFVGDLDYRIIGTLCHDTTFVKNNDRGSDGCNHDWNGIAILSGPEIPQLGETQGMKIQDIAKTVLRTMDVKPPPSMYGKDWSSST